MYFPVPPKPELQASACEAGPSISTSRSESRLFRVWKWSPAWAWMVAAVVQVVMCLPFWLFTSPSPYSDYWGDVYRGRPYVYGLDQGDVGGDEWGRSRRTFIPSRLPSTL